MGDIPKMQGRTWLSHCPRPLDFEIPTLGVYPTLQCKPQWGHIVRVFVVYSMHHGRASPNTALIVKIVSVNPSFEGLDILVLVLSLPTKSKGVPWKRKLQFEKSTKLSVFKRWHPKPVNYKLGSQFKQAKML
jgi:hypothetical protein